VVSAALVYQKHAVTGEIASKSRGQISVSHWIMPVDAVVSAASAHPECLSPVRLVSLAYVVISAALVHQNYTVASEYTYRKVAERLFRRIFLPTLTRMPNGARPSPP
jgi:hypothetical protein